MYNSEEEEEYISIFDNSNNIHEITLNENLFNILTSDFNNSKVLSPIRYNINKINDIKVIKEPNVSINKHLGYYTGQVERILDNINQAYNDIKRYYLFININNIFPII